ncbi:MAG: hypothetical protein AAGB16_05725 [Pseudomonadota bacterium]
MIRKALFAALSVSMLTACASLEPEPCTTEWVEWKTDRLLTEFARANYSEVQNLKSFAQTLEDGNVGPLTALKIPSMIEDFKTLAADFEDRTLPELNAAVKQCGTAQELIPAFTAFLRKEGVGETVIEWVELIGELTQT